jgi:hypothetical protein
MSAYKNLAMKMAQRKFAGHQMSSPMDGLRRPVMAPPAPRQRQAEDGSWIANPKRYWGR